MEFNWIRVTSDWKCMALPNIDYGENCSITIALALLSGDGEGGKKSAVLLLELIMLK